VVVAILEIGGGRNGHPQIGVDGEFEALRHDADDGGGLSVDAHRLADDAGGAVVALLPKSVPKHHHGRCAGIAVAGHEAAAQDGRCVQHGKQARSGVFQVIGLRGIAGVGEDAVIAGTGLDRFERGSPIAVGAEVRPGEAYAVVAMRAVAVADGDEAVAARDGRRPDQHGIDQGEDHGVGADAEREGDDDGCRKPAMGEDHAQRDAKIVGHTCRTTAGDAWFRGLLCEAGRPWHSPNRGSRLECLLSNRIAKL
jgi:hypothetical protein